MTRPLKTAKLQLIQTLKNLNVENCVICDSICYFIDRGDHFYNTQRRKNASNSSHANNNKNNEIKASENDLSSAKAPVTIDPNIHERIDHLIDIRHLSAAEALINQTLNRDPSRHDLYLYLLDLHLRQNDELGIKQLIQNLQQSKKLLNRMAS